MPWAQSKSAGRARRANLRKANAGYFGKRKNCLRTAKDAYWRAGVYAYAGRRQNKRNFRSLWILRINAAARINGMTYGRFISGLKKMNSEQLLALREDLRAEEDRLATGRLDLARRYLETERVKVPREEFDAWFGEVRDAP